MRQALAALLFLAVGCGSDVASDEQARRAYQGIDGSIDRAITLGFAGFNSASSANISPQMGPGGMSGTLTVTGQVDQGSSANKGMRLLAAYVGYSDDAKIIYATDQAAPVVLNMQLKGIPTGTLDGTFIGTIAMTGEISGPLMLNLSFAGQLQSSGGMMVTRKPGTTRITGTAVSQAGTYNVDVTR